MRINKGMALSVGLLASVSLGIAQKPMFPLLPGYENSIIFKSAVSQYSISSLHSLYFLPSIQESKNEPQSLSGWKKVGVVSTELTISTILNLPVAFYFNLFFGAHFVSDQEAKRILWQYVGYSSIVSSISVWGVGHIFNDRKSYWRALLGGVAGGVIGKILIDILLPASYGANAFNLFIFSPLGATIGYNL